MTISVLLTVHNRKKTTINCLSILYGLSLPQNCSIKVYLTDDGSTDGTRDEVLKNFPDVHIIKGDGNLYWNRGMYVAWEEAAKVKDYDYYLWLNDDTFLYKYSIQLLIEASTSKEDKAIIVGATVDTATKHTPTYGGRIKGKGVAPAQGTLVAVDYFNGNVVLIPRSVYQALGNLDYYFTHSKGDFDYGLRAAKAGIRIYQVGMYVGECDVHPTLDKWCDPKVPFKDRWKMLHKPNGMPPKETFHLEKRHYGLCVASFHYLTTILRCVCPQVWIKYKI